MEAAAAAAPPRGPGAARGAPRGAAPAPLNPSSSGRRFASAAMLLAKTFWCAWSALSFARASLECVASSATRAISAGERVRVAQKLLRLLALDLVALVALDLLLLHLLLVRHHGVRT